MVVKTQAINLKDALKEKEIIKRLKEFRKRQYIIINREGE
ncbi:hypothetical protein ES705_04868 [subsurface metagenome]